MGRYRTKDLYTSTTSDNYYETAFKKAFECEREDFELERSFDNGPMLVKYEGIVYEVSSEQDLINMCEESLTSHMSASLVSSEILIALMDDEDYHTRTDFFIYFFEQLDESEHQAATLALSAAKVAQYPSAVFWRSLASLDNTSMLLGKAVVAATLTADLEKLCIELTDLLTSEGEIYLNEMDEEHFEYLNVKGEEGDKTMYIYKVDPEMWEGKRPVVKKNKVKKQT